MLFNELAAIVRPVNLDKTDKMSDLEYRLNTVETILKRIIYTNPGYLSKSRNVGLNGVWEAVEYFKEHEETK